MSAIAGIFDRREQSANIVDPLRLCMAALKFYGPDGRNHWLDDTVGLGWQKMIVTPQSRWEQLPRYDPVYRLAITADLWLDNREDLSAILDVPPSARAEVTDSELILRAYRKWGSECAKHLLGDFAFVIWDSEKRTLFCVRDHIGAKPFYYSLTPERFVFASDINGVLVVPGVSDRLNEAYVAAHLQNPAAFFSTRLTFFNDIRKLPPAHALTIRPDSVRLERYWDPEQSPEIRLPSDADYAEAFRDLYQKAIRASLRSAYPIGSHVSGGLDCSGAAVLAARELRQQGKSLAAFCWESLQNGETLPSDERSLIRLVCEQENLTLDGHALTVEDFVNLLQRDVTREPTTDLNHEMIVQQQAQARGIRVLLSGWGGDELTSFNGRGYYANLLNRGRWIALYRKSKLKSPRHPWKFLITKAVLPQSPQWCKDMATKLHPNLIPSIHLPSYINPEFARAIRRAAAHLQPKPWREVSVRQTQLRLLELGHLTGRLEAWAANGAHHNLVYRYPLLDKRIVEFALGLPAEQFVGSQYARSLMRRAMEGILPPQVQWNRNKREPARFNCLWPVVCAALTTIGRRLAELPSPPARSIYLDMPRLQRRLTTDFPENRAEQRSLLHAVFFLDF